MWLGLNPEFQSKAEPFRRPLRPCVLVRVPLALMKHHDHKQPGEERARLGALGSHSVTEGSQGRDLQAGAEEQRPWRSLLTGLLLSGRVM